MVFFSHFFACGKGSYTAMVFFSHFFACGRKLHRYGVFSAFLCLWKEATSLWCFFRISLLVEGSDTALVFFSHFFACAKKRSQRKHPYPLFPKRG